MIGSKGCIPRAYNVVRQERKQSWSILHGRTGNNGVLEFTTWRRRKKAVLEIATCRKGKGSVLVFTYSAEERKEFVLYLTTVGGGEGGRVKAVVLELTIW